MDNSFEVIGRARIIAFVSSDLINARTELGRQEIKTAAQTMIDKNLSDEKEARPLVNNVQNFIHETLFLCGKTEIIPCMRPIEIGSKFYFGNAAFITMKDGLITDISAEYPQS